MENDIFNSQAAVYLKIILAIGVGLLIGLEREYASKDIGIRTFSLASLLGMVTGMLGENFAICGFIGILSIALLVNVRAILTHRNLEVTTSVALLATFFLGVLVEGGHIFVPVALSILMTMLLAWKEEMTHFTQGLQLEEIRSAVVLGLLTFVIYPILPDKYVDPWGLVNPKQAWITILVLAGLSFLNYILLKLYSTKGLYYSALLGGAVNSAAAVTEVASVIKKQSQKFLGSPVSILLMVTVAMFIRNLVILAALSPEAILLAVIPLFGMIGTAFFFIWRGKGSGVPLQSSENAPLQVSSPVSLRKVLSFGLLFLFLQVTGALAQRHLGSYGFLTLSFLGGLISSSSATAAAAKLATEGSISANIAGVAVILSSVSSAFVNLPLAYQVTKDKVLLLKLGVTTALCVLAGLLLMALVAWTQSMLG